MADDRPTQSEEVPLVELPEDLLDEEPNGELPEEDDDNPYQESDEALPDELEEAVLRKDPSKEGSRFDEV
ncbi:hypothetical protein [Mesorhizobium australicum]|uniref:Uncharacterized protein n=1 Tax=Mesorhizobium australicum TaxID=536018 RepID=A0A1X7NQD4_9HYPH|nr:hypothetical protein [Mesorhizobium australicum]SMH40246.1 hypothetical protein SAMN02982922_2287 [Mesorhizobium australicum]